MAKKALQKSPVAPRATLSRFLSLACAVCAVLLFVISLFGLATPNGKLGALSLPLFCFAFLAAACVAGAELICSYLSQSRKVARLSHAAVCLIFCYIAAGILFAFGILKLDLTSIFGIIAILFSFLAIYGVTFLLLWGIGKLLSLLPEGIRSDRWTARALWIHQGISFLFLCYAAIFAALRQTSEIGMHLAQYALLLLFSAIFVAVAGLLQKKNTALRLLALWAVTLSGFTFAIMLPDVNGILPFTNLAERFSAYGILTLLFWAISLIAYGIKRAISAQKSKKEPADSKKSTYEKMF